MTKSKSLLLSCTFLTLSVGCLSAASISLDTSGGDPDITSPNFTFTTDAQGNFGPASFHNVSVPPVNFINLTLIAPFSPAFYGTLTAPGSPGITCNPGNSFNTCSINENDLTTTITLSFSGLDATHIGLPYLDFLGVRATGFEPNQTIQGNSSIVTAATPEPGTSVLAITGITLACVVSRKKLLKLGVRS